MHSICGWHCRNWFTKSGWLLRHEMGLLKEHNNAMTFFRFLHKIDKLVLCKFLLLLHVRVIKVQNFYDHFVAYIQFSHTTTNLYDDIT